MIGVNLLVGNRRNVAVEVERKRGEEMEPACAAVIHYFWAAASLSR